MSWLFLNNERHHDYKRRHMIKYKLNSFATHTGNTIIPPHAGVTCIVGANNTGKSQLLSDLLQYMQHGPLHSQPAVILKNASRLFDQPPPEEIDEWVSKTLIKINGDHGRDDYVTRSRNAHTDRNSIIHLFDHASGDSATEGLNYLTEEFAIHSTAGSLSKYVQGTIKEIEDLPTEDRQSQVTLDTLYRNDSALETINQAVRDLFGTSIIMDKTTPFHRLKVGVTTTQAPPINQVPQVYIEELAALPDLDDQGDGLRSFVGLAAIVVGLQPDVLLLDEPDAFLHPAQARAAGRWLVQMARKNNVQVLTTTHNRDFLLGLLDGRSFESVALGRISRDNNDVAEITAVDPESLRSMWDQPIVKYSNIFEGLFYANVVICEGGTDCLFYQASIEASSKTKKARELVDNTLFLSAHGKQNIKDFICILREFGVRTTVICDFDTLLTPRDMQSILDAQIDDWSDMKRLESSVTGMLSDKTKTEKKALKREGIKQLSTNEYERLAPFLEELKKHRILVVLDGELESFYREARRGKNWVAQAFKFGAHSLGAAQQFMQTLHATLETE